MREKTLDIKSRRNYTQMEKDMLEKFYQNTTQKLEVLSSNILLKEGSMQKMEEDHQRVIRMYLQKMKHLELEKDKNKKEVQDEAETAKETEDEFHEQNIDKVKAEKELLKTTYIKQEKLNEDLVTRDVQGSNFEKKNLDVRYNEKYENMERRYKMELEELRAKLELKLKVEIHEIEERKNLHINDLMKNHELSYRDLKKFYNDITAENLDLIKAQKEEIKKIKSRTMVNQMDIQKLRKENQLLEAPLERDRRIAESLRQELKQYEKDKLSLANLKIKLVSLAEKYKKLKKEKHQIDEEYEKAFNDKKNLLDRFDAIVLEMQKNTEIQNFILDQHVDQRQTELQLKEQRLQEIVIGSGLDSHFVNEITEKMRETMEDKNGQIKKLKYLIHHATKAYNDAIRVYEQKLVEFNILPQELGFQPIPSITSTMPAGLVSS